MVKLFQYCNYEVAISEEALTLKAFKDIWDRDKTKKKEKAIAELGYIYFLCDPRSDYMMFPDRKVRSEEIIKAEGVKINPDDPLLLEGIKLYESFKPVGYGLLEDTRMAIENLRVFLREIDLNQTDDRGKLIHSVSSVTNTIKQIPALVSALNEAEKALAHEISQARMRGGQEKKKLFEDGVD